MHLFSEILLLQNSHGEKKEQQPTFDKTQHNNRNNMVATNDVVHPDRRKTLDEAVDYFNTVFIPAYTDAIVNAEYIQSPYDPNEIFEKLDYGKHLCLIPCFRCNQNTHISFQKNLMFILRRQKNGRKS